MGTLEAIYDYVDARFPEWTQELAELCSYPGTAGNPQPLEPARQLLLKKLERLGLAGTRYPVEGGNDILFGSRAGADPRYVLFYNHYDVVEGGDSTQWKTGDPYALQTIDGRMYARGISDNKGALMSRLHAVEAILSVAKELPVGVKLLWEGDEEIGSPSLSRFAAEQAPLFRQLTQADVCLWENGRIDEEGRAWARYGVRGSCCFFLTVATARREAHTRLSAVVPNAAYRLCAAIATLQDARGRIAIDGFYDAVRQPDGADREVLERFPYDWAPQRRALGLPEEDIFRSEEVKYQIYTQPCLCVCGLDAGGLHQAPKGIIPHTARAMISFELVADLDPDLVETLLRRHLDRHGFADVRLESWGKNVPVKTRVDIPFTQRLQRATQEVFGKPLVIEPLQLGPGPAHLFRRAWPEMPVVGIGPGNLSSNHHAPDENLRLEDYKKAVKHCIALLYAYQEESVV